MSEKMTCPGCDAHSSSVRGAVVRNEQCPFCGLSAAAILERQGVRKSKADEALKEKVAKLVTDRDKWKHRAEKAELILRGVRSLLESES